MGAHRIDLSAVRSALSLTNLGERVGRPVPYDRRRWCAVSTRKANTYTRPPVFAWGRVDLVYITAMRERNEAPTPCDLATRSPERQREARAAAGISTN